MLTKNDYTLKKKLLMRNDIAVYIAIREADHQNILLKIPTKTASYKDIAAFHHEYELFKQINIPGVIHVHELNETETPLLELEYTEGISLNEFLNGKPLTLEQFFNIAKQIVNIIGLLHEKNIIHKNVNPTSFLIDPNTLQIKLIDLSISTKVSGMEQEFIHPNILEGTLAYLSPEQTGRLNNPIDYRSDFYSMGITFFEMLTGVLPFQSSDPLEIIYFQIAKTPASVSELNPSIPPMIDKIIQKLLAKEPEKRYKSSKGLKLDLENCEKQWLKSQAINDFELGLFDVADHLQISHSLYGREEQSKILLDNYEAIANGGKKLVLISGYSGIGKTTLVHEVYKSITKYHGYYITGKYAQLERSSPYSAFINAFQDLIKQMLSLSAEELKQHKEDLIVSLGSSINDIISIIPEMEKIVGKQNSSTTPEDYEQKQEQINLAFKRLIKAIANKEHPLVIFLDDLQWADTSSLKLMQNLITDPEINFLMIIGAFRDNEVTQGHPLQVTMNYMQSMNAPITPLQLNPLTIENIKDLIKDTFFCNTELTNGLAQVLLKKTHGNPFFINEFLKALYRNQLISYSYTKGSWDWNTDEIMQLNVTENVADLLSTEFKKLPTKTQTLLNLAACIGHQFNLVQLASIIDQPPKEVVKNLWLAVEMGLIVPIGEAYKLNLITDNVELVHEEILSEVQFRFNHDRVQQAAYNLVSEEERKQIHLDIGQKLLLAAHDKGEKVVNENIFNIVNQLNYSIDLIDQSQREELVRLNLIAGKKALNSAAVPQAITYLNMCQSLIDEKLWDKNPNLMFEIQLHRVITFFFNKEFDELIHLANETTTKLADPHKKAILYRYIVMVYNSTGEYTKEINVGKLALSALGVDIPDKVSIEDIVAEFQKTEAEISKINIEEVPNLPKMEDPAYRNAMSILKVIINAYYMAAPEFFPIIGCKMVQISLQHGNSPESSYAYCCYGMIKYAITNDPHDCYMWNKAGLETFRHVFDKKLAAAVYFMSQYFGYTWKIKFSDTFPLLLEGFKIGIETGDFQYGCFSSHAIGALTFLMGKNMEPAYLEAEELLKPMILHKQSVPYYILELYYQVMHNLMNVKEQPLDIHLRLMENQNNSFLLDESFENKTVVCKGYTFKAFIAYLTRDYKASYEASCIADKYVSALPGSPVLFYHTFFKALSALALVSGETKSEERNKLLDVIKANLDKVKHNADLAPDNFMPHYLILTAENARVNEQDAIATEAYDKAIMVAANDRNLYALGIANECAGHYYLNKNRLPLAEYYLNKAFSAYYDWGCLTKCKLLEKQFPQWFHAQITEKQMFSSFDTAASAISVPINALDAISLLKSTRAIASEIRFDKLVKKLMSIILENIGADRGILASYQNDKWSVEINAEFKDKEFVLIKDTKEIPLSLMNYVKNTHKALIVQSVHENDLAMSDAYIAKTHPKSILLVPLFYKHKFRRLLYLENTNTTNAFSSQQLYMLRMLLGQIAISIENSKLYESTTRFVPEPVLKLLHKSSILDISPGESIEKKVTVMFTDIRNYTHLSEELTAKETFAFVNKYITHMAPIIRKHHGFIVQYLGDAILSLYPKKPSDALHAALEMRMALNAFNKEQAANNYPPIQVGYGINTGNAMLGLLGEEERIDTSVISDAINLASRLENLNKIYGTVMLASNYTIEDLENPDEFSLRIIDKVRVKGKLKSIDLYEIMAVPSKEDEIKQQKNLELFSQAFAMYKQNDFTSALELFNKYLKDNQNDKPAEILRNRCKIFVETGTPEDWDGTYTMLIK